MLVRVGKDRTDRTFEKGLNTILGAFRASNSIGKSTFLMIIDFVFGGKDYMTLNNDVERNIGIHEIKFAFQFGENTYYFSWSTGDHTKVMECNEKYEPVKEITLDTYCNFLSLQYECRISELAFGNWSAASSGFMADITMMKGTR